jgi:23S rRNA (pseudouridine1915-N3)-methyltransferase
MIKIKIFSPNKTKELWLEEALDEYIKRLKSTVEITFVYAKNDEHLLELIKKETSFIALDPKGKAFTSEEFSTYIHQSLIHFGSRLNFVIGGPDGLPEEIKKDKELISFSKMTFTHQVIRLILVEQIYRAFEIAKGSPYHK